MGAPGPSVAFLLEGSVDTSTNTVKQENFVNMQHGEVRDWNIS